MRAPNFLSFTSSPIRATTDTVAPLGFLTLLTPLLLPLRLWFEYRAAGTRVLCLQFRAFSFLFFSISSYFFLSFFCPHQPPSSADNLLTRFKTRSATGTTAHHLHTPYTAVNNTTLATTRNICEASPYNRTRDSRQTNSASYTQQQA